MSEATILTVTKRTGWWKDQLKSYNSQTFKPRWIIVAEPGIRPRSSNIAKVADIIKSPPKIRHSNLNASLNEGLRHIYTDYVIFWQDFIDLPKDSIAQLVRSAKETGGFVTTATINPDGQHDARYLGVDTIRPCMPEEWEANVAIAPMKALEELGGFDETYDDGWSWDNVSVAERAAMLGYEFFIDERIKPQLLYHPKEPDLDSTLRINGEYHAKRMQEIRDRIVPIQLPYL